MAQRHSPVGGSWSLVRAARHTHDEPVFYLRDLLNAHFSSWTGRAHAIDSIRLPGWLDRRLGWNRQRDLEEFQRVERSAEQPPIGKDASKDR